MLFEMLFVSTDEGDGVDLRLSRSLPISDIVGKGSSSSVGGFSCLGASRADCTLRFLLYHIVHRYVKAVHHRSCFGLTDTVQV